MLPSAEKCSTLNVGKAVDQRKNEQHGATCRAIQHATVLKAVNEWKNQQHGAIHGAKWRPTVVKAIDKRNYQEFAASRQAILHTNRRERH